MAKRSCIIFDLDGTLLNTLQDLADACNFMLEKHGWPTHDTDSYRQRVGRGFVNIVKRSLPQNIRIDMSTRDECLELTKRYYARHMRDTTTPYPGINEMLMALKSRGCRLGVLSNKVENMTVELVEHYFPNLFDAVHGGRDDLPLKPHPASLLLQMAELQASHEETLYVGDSLTDVQTAQNAGVISIGCSWGFRERFELRKAGCDHIIDTPAQLLEALYMF